MAALTGYKWGKNKWIIVLREFLLHASILRAIEHITQKAAAAPHQREVDFTAINNNEINK